jgi:hypothetical protein
VGLIEQIHEQPRPAKVVVPEMRAFADPRDVSVNQIRFGVPAGQAWDTVNVGPKDDALSPARGTLDIRTG